MASSQPSYSPSNDSASASRCSRVSPNGTPGGGTSPLATTPHSRSSGRVPGGVSSSKYSLSGGAHRYALVPGRPQLRRCPLGCRLGREVQEVAHGWGRRRRCRWWLRHRCFLRRCCLERWRAVVARMPATHDLLDEQRVTGEPFHRQVQVLIGELVYPGILISIPKPPRAYLAGDPVR